MFQQLKEFVGLKDSANVAGLPRFLTYCYYVESYESRTYTAANFDTWTRSPSPLRRSRAIVKGSGRSVFIRLPGARTMELGAMITHCTWSCCRERCRSPRSRLLRGGQEEQILGCSLDGLSHAHTELNEGRIVEQSLIDHGSRLAHVAGVEHLHLGRDCRLPQPVWRRRRFSLAG